MSRGAIIDSPPDLCECDCEEDAGDDGLCPKCKKPVEIPAELQAEVDDLARRWSALHDEIEREGFDRMARYEDGADDFEPDDEPELVAEVTAKRRMRDELRTRELASIEEMLAERGARMMRPYEHWNEDERFMEWSERERD